MTRVSPISLFFFFNDTATTEIYTLSLHDALPIFNRISCSNCLGAAGSLQILITPPDALPNSADDEPRSTSMWSADRKSTRLNSSHSQISYAVFCLEKKNNKTRRSLHFPCANNRIA